MKQILNIQHLHISQAKGQSVGEKQPSCWLGTSRTGNIVHLSTTGACPCHCGLQDSSTGQERSCCVLGSRVVVHLLHHGEKSLCAGKIDIGYSSLSNVLYNRSDDFYRISFLNIIDKQS